VSGIGSPNTYTDFKALQVPSLCYPQTKIRTALRPAAFLAVPQQRSGEHFRSPCLSAPAFERGIQLPLEIVTRSFRFGFSFLFTESVLGFSGNTSCVLPLLTKHTGTGLLCPHFTSRQSGPVPAFCSQTKRDWSAFALISLLGESGPVPAFTPHVKRSRPIPFQVKIGRFQHKRFRLITL